MFEQSVVLEPHPARKISAIAGSIGAQILAVGVLIVVPLLYNEVLPFVRPALPLTPPSLTTRAPEVAQTSAATRPNTVTLAARRVFVDRRISNNTPAAASPTFIMDDTLPPGPPSGGGVPFSIGQTASPSRLTAIVAPPEPVAKPSAPPKPARISLGAEPAVPIRKVLPIYPPLARQARISGTVKLMGVIAKDGTIQELKVISGPPMLIKAALDAVRQWVYRPTLLSGDPVEVACPIDVIFTLSQ